uniref:Uncharacterized protein n=1 Tax=Timema genevievae TaxID=629358 RepID=A0A7R9K9U2_TIMGE|nr:unnamed protein product [Timema genevievae]
MAEASSSGCPEANDQCSSPSPNAEPLLTALVLRRLGRGRPSPLARPRGWPLARPVAWSRPPRVSWLKSMIERRGGCGGGGEGRGALLEAAERQMTPPPPIFRPTRLLIPADMGVREGERQGLASQPTKVSFLANKNRGITENVDSAGYRTGLANKSYVWKYQFSRELEVFPYLREMRVESHCGKTILSITDRDLSIDPPVIGNHLTREYSRVESDHRGREDRDSTKRFIVTSIRRFHIYRHDNGTTPTPMPVVTKSLINLWNAFTLTDMSSTCRCRRRHVGGVSSPQ